MHHFVLAPRVSSAGRKGCSEKPKNPTAIRAHCWGIILLTNPTEFYLVAFICPRFSLQSAPLQLGGSGSSNIAPQWDRPGARPVNYSHCWTFGFFRLLSGPWKYWGVRQMVCLKCEMQKCSPDSAAQMPLLQCVDPRGSYRKTPWKIILNTFYLIIFAGK